MYNKMLTFYYQFFLENQGTVNQTTVFSKNQTTRFGSITKNPPFAGPTRSNLGETPIGPLTTYDFEWFWVYSFLIGRFNNKDNIAIVIAVPAEGPSFLTAPCGQ
jgi:hypothetical protein